MADRDTSIIQATSPSGLSLGGTLTTLLTMTEEAVIVFSGAGKILLANEEALALFTGSVTSVSERVTDLVGYDVRSLFPRVEGVGLQAPFAPEHLPLPVDGTLTRVLGNDGSAQAIALMVRCKPADGQGEAYLLTAHRERGDAGDMRDHERLVAELSRANRRLAGTLDIVLGTLDSPSVGTLFERVLEELCQTMDATGTTVYLAESDGFRLRGTSASLRGVQVPRYLPYVRPLTRLVSSGEQALRLRVLPPDSTSLRLGKLTHRMVMDEGTRKTYRVRQTQVPPFKSLLAVAVRFGGQVIALIEVGWRSARTIPEDDATLLEAVTRYLAVQLVGAFSALRAQRREQLSTRANDLRDELVAQPFSSEVRAQVLDAVARDLGCTCAPLDGPSALDDHEVLHLPVSHEERAVPSRLLGTDEGVTSLLPDAPLGTWLREQGEPCMGALVSCGEGMGERIRFLALRSVDDEPFDDLELEYLRQVSDTVNALSTGSAGHQRDHRIAQALQTGMRSELQQVEGISSQGIYSSATQAAFVGGDFYDLIRLPNRRACVIMGDVSGKGVEAASVSAAVRTALGAYSWEGLAPARMVSLLNDFLLGFSRVETFATLFVGIIDLRVATLTYCSAGHPPALLHRGMTGALEWLSVQSGVVGAFHEMSYRDGVVELREKDILLLYTDGVTEARARNGRFFGEDGLRDALMREAVRGFEGLVERLLVQVDAFTGNSLDDDVAMVALRFDDLGEAGD